jgi:hypothetical protein
VCVSEQRRTWTQVSARTPKNEKKSNKSSRKKIEKEKNVMRRKRRGAAQ